VPILRAGVHRIWTDNTVGVTPRGRVKSMVLLVRPNQSLSTPSSSLVTFAHAKPPPQPVITSPAPRRALHSLRRMGRAPGDRGAATLNCVDDRKARAASADQKRLARLNERLRHAFIDGAEMDSRRRLGRGLTARELERVLRRYPGDAGERRKPY
jgi:hypothetical protein